MKSVNVAIRLINKNCPVYQLLLLYQSYIIRTFRVKKNNRRTELSGQKLYFLIAVRSHKRKKTRWHLPRCTTSVALAKAATWRQRFMANNKLQNTTAIAFTIPFYCTWGRVNTLYPLQRSRALLEEEEDDEKKEEIFISIARAKGTRFFQEYETIKQPLLSEWLSLGTICKSAVAASCLHSHSLCLSLHLLFSALHKCIKHFGNKISQRSKQYFCF